MDYTVFVLKRLTSGYNAWGEEVAKQKGLIELMEKVFCHSEGSEESDTISRDSELYLPEVKDLPQNVNQSDYRLTPQFLIEPQKDKSHRNIESVPFRPKIFDKILLAR